MLHWQQSKKRHIKDDAAEKGSSTKKVKGKENQNANNLINCKDEIFPVEQTKRLRAIEACCVHDEKLLLQFKNWVHSGANARYCSKDLSKICKIVDHQLCESSLALCWAPSYCSTCLQESLFYSVCHICWSSNSVQFSNWPSTQQAIAWKQFGQSFCYNESKIE